jgi:hypothetical protein
MDQQEIPDGAVWADRLANLRVNFQSTYDAMAQTLEETSAQWDADLQALAAVLQHMQDLDRQRRQLIDAAADRLRRLHALWLQVTMTGATPVVGVPPGPEPTGPVRTAMVPASAVVAPSVDAPTRDTPPAAPSLESPPDTVPDSVPDRFSGGAEPRHPEPPPFANPAATYGPPLPTDGASPAGDPGLPRLVQSF